MPLYLPQLRDSSVSFAEYTGIIGDPWIVSGGLAALTVNVILTAYVIMAWNDPEPAGHTHSSAPAKEQSREAPLVPPGQKHGKEQ